MVKPSRGRTHNIWYDIYPIKRLVPKDPNNRAIWIGDCIGEDYSISHIFYDQDDDCWLVFATNNNDTSDICLHAIVNDHAIERIEYFTKKEMISDK